MDKRAVRGWVMYDWANSAFATTIMAAVMPIFYADVAGKGLDWLNCYLLLGIYPIDCSCLYCLIITSTGGDC